MFRTTRRVDFADTDMAGIVHFANFFRYMEAAEVAFLRSLGVSVKVVWEGQELHFPRVSAHCDYKSPARFDEVLRIGVGILKIGAKSITYSFEFTRENSEEVVAIGQVTSVCCRALPDHRIESVEIPATFRVLLEKASH